VECKSALSSPKKNEKLIGIDKDTRVIISTFFRSSRIFRIQHTCGILIEIELECPGLLIYTQETKGNSTALEKYCHLRSTGCGCRLRDAIRRDLWCRIKSDELLSKKQASNIPRFVFFFIMPSLSICVSGCLFPRLLEKRAQKRETLYCGCCFSPENCSLFCRISV